MFSVSRPAFWLAAAAFISKPGREVASAYSTACPKPGEDGNGQENRYPRCQPWPAPHDAEKVLWPRPRCGWRCSLCPLHLGNADGGTGTHPQQVRQCQRWMHDYPCTGGHDPLGRRKRKRGSEVFGENRRQSFEARIPGLADRNNSPPEQSLLHLREPCPDLVIP